MLNTATIVNYLVQSGYLAAAASIAVSAIKNGKTYLDAKTAEATAKIKDTNVKNAVNTAEDCVTTVVMELAQTTVEALKAKTTDGKLTPEDAAAIKATALAKVQALLSDDVIHTLNTLFGNAEAWTDSKIEAAVKALKPNTGSTAAAAIAALQSTAESEQTPVPADDTGTQNAVAAEPTQSAQPEVTAAPQNITLTVTVPATATQGEIVQQVTAALQQAQASAQQQ